MSGEGEAGTGRSPVLGPEALRARLPKGEGGGVALEVPSSPKAIPI